MNEKVKAFYLAVSADDALQSELTAVTEGVNMCNPIGMSDSVLCFGEGVDPSGGKHRCLPSGGRFAY